MTPVSSSTVGRILMAVDASLQNYDALEAAAEFASHLETQLVALFVEDINLFKLAELPFAKELDRSSGVMRSLSPDSVTRALKADAQKFEKRLSEESAKRRISVSMKVVRGHYAAAALEIADKSDIVFVHNVTSLAYGLGRVKSTRSGLRRAGSLKKPIWVFYDESEQAERALKLALSLCQKSGSDINVVLPKSAAQSDLTSRLSSELKGSGVAGCQILSMSDAEQIIAVAQLSGGSVLILPRDYRQYAETADMLAGKLGCHRILV